VCSGSSSRLSGVSFDPFLRRSNRCDRFFTPQGRKSMTRIIKEARRRRSPWLLVLPVLVLAIAALSFAVGASAINTHPALNTFSPVVDDQGANDAPGQKDLTLQGTNNSDVANGNLWVVWNWDDTQVSGGNTMDACTLFDSDADGNANLAVCLTLVRVGGQNPTVAMQSSTPIVYTCGDTRNDRCASQILAVNAQGSFCELETNVTGAFDGADTQAYCDIKITALGLSSATTLLNTCSYPSQQPNSDPSDCVLIPGAVSSSTGTTPGGTPTWHADLTDTATITPSGKTGGTVTFKLFAASDATCAGTPIYTAISPVTNSAASTATASSTTGSNSVNIAGVYHWTADYSGISGVNSSSSACGEATTVTAASVT
jgi:hypothetical protein